MSEENLLPNKTVTILIIVALLVTIIGTWTVLYKVNTIKLHPIQQTVNFENTNADNGKFTLSIKQASPTNIGGEIVLNIV